MRIGCPILGQPYSFYRPLILRYLNLSFSVIYMPWLRFVYTSNEKATWL